MGSENVKFEQDKLFFSPEGSIRTNAVTVNVKYSKRWNSSVKRICVGEIDTTAVSYYLSARGGSAFGGKNYSVISPQVLKEFKVAVKSQNKELFNYNVATVLGLGFGLTPSGDDFLVGFLSASHFFEALPSFGFFLKNVRVDYSKTNFISAEYLRYATVGRISEVVTNTVISVSEKKSDASFWLINLVNIGATSGYDTLLGILTAMDIYNDCKSC